MKRIQLISKTARQSIVAVLLLFVLLAGCGDKIKGTFYLSEKAKMYTIDTTITSFTMIDDVGITEDFVMDRHTWYTQHHYFNNWGVDGDAKGEVFGIAFNSTINNYFFTYVLRADETFSTLEIEWVQKDMFTLNLDSEKIISGKNAHISFLDSLQVNQKTYKNVIMVDYRHMSGETHNKTPVVSYFSAHYGLIKLIRKDGIVSTRLYEELPTGQDQSKNH
ncbi:MAG: hypothetical protein PF489_01495 [Salinivirgaceae bacterium]|jgi:predicted small lipoprotein YifL|nr:hypothetical protein [Salinivirgaceae bacterium]